MTIFLIICTVLTRIVLAKEINLHMVHEEESDI